MFQILRDFIDKEAGGVDWTFDEEHLNARKKMDELLEWWDDTLAADNDDCSEVNDKLKQIIDLRGHLWT